MDLTNIILSKILKIIKKLINNIVISLGSSLKLISLRFQFKL
jgi:hypothetical protein